MEFFWACSSISIVVFPLMYGVSTCMEVVYMQQENVMQCSAYVMCLLVRASQLYKTITPPQTLQTPQLPDCGHCSLHKVVYFMRHVNGAFTTFGRQPVNLA